MADTYSDGDYTDATQVGPTVKTWDATLLCYFYRRTFHQLASEFEKLTTGTEGPTDAYLYEETEPRHIGGGLIEWDRLYMEIPPNREEPEGYIFSRQWLTSEGVVEAAIPTTSIIAYTYTKTDDPITDITILSAFRYIQIGSFIYSVGDAGNNTGGRILAEDSAIRKVRGNIWERASRYVTDVTLNEE